MDNIELGYKISELNRKLANIIRVGKVVEVDYKLAKAKIKCGDITTDFLPWLIPSTAIWIPLKNGEQVVVLSPCGDLSFGMILPALYQSAKPAPSSDTTKIAVVADIIQTGSLEVSKDIMATGEVEGKGVKLSTHTHDFNYNAGSSPSTATTKKPS